MLNMQNSVSGDKNVILISKQQEIAIKCENRVTYTYHMPSLFKKNILSLDLASGNITSLKCMVDIMGKLVS